MKTVKTLFALLLLILALAACGKGEEPQHVDLPQEFAAPVEAMGLDTTKITVLEQEGKVLVLCTTIDEDADVYSTYVVKLTGAGYDVTDDTNVTISQTYTLENGMFEISITSVFDINQFKQARSMEIRNLDKISSENLVVRMEAIEEELDDEFPAVDPSEAEVNPASQAPASPPKQSDDAIAYEPQIDDDAIAHEPQLDDDDAIAYEPPIQENAQDTALDDTHADLHPDSPPPAETFSHSSGPSADARPGNATEADAYEGTGR